MYGVCERNFQTRGYLAISTHFLMKCGWSWFPLFCFFLSSLSWSTQHLLRLNDLTVSWATSLYFMPSSSYFFKRQWQPKVFSLKNNKTKSNESFFNSLFFQVQLLNTIFGCVYGIPNHLRRVWHRVLTSR